MAFIIDDIAVVSAAAEATIESESPNAVESTIAKDATAAIDDIAKQSSSVDSQKVEGDSPSSEESLDNAHFVDDFPAQVANDVLSEIGSITEDNVFYDEFPSETESLSNSDPESSTQTIPINNVIENELPTNSNSPLDRMQNRDVNAEDISTETKTSLENDANLDTPLSQNETNELSCKDYKNCPLEGSNGHWEGERGESKWYPDSDSVPSKNNPDGKTWGNIMEEFDIDGIQFNEGEPDFSEISKGEITLDAPESDRGIVFNEADTKLAQERGCEPWEVAKWRKDNGYTWHEKQDCITAQKIPSIVHGNVSHLGGHAISSRTLNN